MVQQAVRHDHQVLAVGCVGDRLHQLLVEPSQQRSGALLEEPAELLDVVRAQPLPASPHGREAAVRAGERAAF
jgi:hypothetical protein